MIQALLAILSSVGSILASETARVVALKIILYALFTIVLPVILVNVFYEIMDSFLTEALNSSSGFIGSSSSFSLTGFIGFFASCLRLPEVFSIIMGALATKVSFRMIPYVRVVN